MRVSFIISLFIVAPLVLPAQTDTLFTNVYGMKWSRKKAKYYTINVITYDGNCREEKYMAGTNTLIQTAYKRSMNGPYDGECKTYHDSTGQKTGEGVYKDGEMVGLWKHYKDGQLWYTEDHATGELKSYYPSGKL